MLTNEQIGELFQKKFEECETYYQISDKLLKMKDDIQLVHALRTYLCNEVLYLTTMGYVKYDKTNFEKNRLIQLLCENIKLLPKDNKFYQAIYSYFMKEEKQCLQHIEKMMEQDYAEVKDQLKSPDEFMNEGILVDLFFEPFKEGIGEFWTTLSSILRKYPHQNGIPELCEIIAQYYSCKTDDEALELLLNAIIKYPDLILIKELIAYTYYSLKLWNNAIAYFENLGENAIFFRAQDIYFMMAWSYGKIKNYKQEELFYRKTLEVIPGFVCALNNLGYCLYKQKKYLEAKDYFTKCLEYDKEYVYAANNYVRVLIALGRNRDAKDFIKKGNYKVAKDIRKRVDKLDNTNARIKKNIQKEQMLETADSADSGVFQEDAIDLGIKRQQFSNEKLLEDELTARIESGMEVFGLKLKVYKRRGVYGRQFIIPIGRLDLLCEDEKGHLYVIELKKDSGYDDAYKQTAEYLDWFENNEISTGKNVYGIICLNNPTKELIDKVHKDKRMKIFGYQISYREL